MDQTRPATARELAAFCRSAPSEIVDRVCRQRVIAEVLERAARRAGETGRAREANELHEQAAEALAVADRVVVAASA